MNTEVVMKPAVKVPGRSVVAPNFEAIEAVGLPSVCQHWCVWSLVADEESGRTQKRPSNGNRGISSQKPEDWISFEQAKSLYLSGGWDGVGALPSVENGLVGLDLDGVLIEVGGDVEFMAADIVAGLQAIGCWVELSPGGRGLRGFVRGVKSAECKARTSVNGFSVECYQRSEAHKDNFLTATGCAFGVALPIKLPDGQAKLEAFLRAVGLLEAEGNHGVDGCESGSVCGSDEGKAVTAPKKSDKWPVLGESGFDRLFPNYRERTDAELEKLAFAAKYDRDGGLEAIRVAGGKSEERCKLIGHLAYFSRDPDQLARLVRNCPFDRDKLNEKRNGFEDFLDYDIHRLIWEKDRNYDEEVAEAKPDKATAKQREKDLQTQAEAFQVMPIDDLLDSRGKLRADFDVLAELLIRDSRLIGGVYHNEFSMMNVKTVPLRELLGDRLAPATAGDFQEGDLLAAMAWFRRVWGVSVNRDDVIRKVISRWCAACSRNPVADRLESLAKDWDGVSRLEGMFVRYFGCEADGSEQAYYLAEIAKRFMVGTVARALKPGTKQDHMLILENEKGGEGKSFSVQILAEAISPEGYLDSYSPEQSPDSMRLMRGKLLGEWGELAGFGRKESEWVKSFLTKVEDEYRDPWALIHRKWPRTISFIATSNQQRYLQDLGGRRRYWPVRVGRIDLDGLRRDAGLLWGEAVRLHRAGERYWIDGEADKRLAAACDVEQRGRLVSTSYDDACEALAVGVMTGKIKPNLLEPVRGVNEWSMFSRTEMSRLVEDSRGIKTPISDGEWSRLVVLALKRAGWTNEKNLPNGNTGWMLSREKAEALRRQLELPPPPPMPKRGQKKLRDSAAMAYAKEVMARAAEEEKSGDENGIPEEANWGKTNA